VPHPFAFFLAKGWETTNLSGGIGLSEHNEVEPKGERFRGVPGLDFETWDFICRDRDCKPAESAKNVVVEK
jgi:hypothetical protein